MFSCSAELTTAFANYVNITQSNIYLGNNLFGTLFAEYSAGGNATPDVK